MRAGVIPHIHYFHILSEAVRARILLDVTNEILTSHGVYCTTVTQHDKSIQKMHYRDCRNRKCVKVKH